MTPFRRASRWLAVVLVLGTAPPAVAADRSDEVVRRVNALRERHDLPALRVSAALTRAGDRYARTLVQQRHWSHTAPDGSGIAQRAFDAGWTTDGPWVLGENLGYGGGDAATPAGVIRLFLDSPSHRRVLLDPRFREIGVGVADGTPTYRAEASATYAVELGRRY